MTDIVTKVEDFSQLTEREKEEILEFIVDTYGKPVTNFAFTYVKDWGLAEDIAQDVFLKVFDHLHQFRRDASLKTWIYQITANQCKDLMRKKYFKTTLLTDWVGNILNNQRQETSAESKVLQVSQEREIAQEVLRLPIKYREIIILYYYEELSTVKISQFLQMSVATVKTRLQRGRQQLKRSWKGGDWLE
ncbi:sigma-70 family RNA polymerase sigma factor [Alkalihalobacillus sp. MEB130]|uniref:sigma-70 family RNA polymerase sigma factor n=1 Tax=Alkalihalobacillus sp. MEB130 TaxID=2976704 RepID=UPI0028DFA130|nr:sigma-70 family RNA polymerase sigma factor [Alkalihalobacillus sp. MEB130]MDT8858870.1 sigma-70 family RNA polymerase sigma factor [Alkalihalobacillus sp. MEB130]